MERAAPEWPLPLASAPDRECVCRIHSQSGPPLTGRGRSLSPRRPRETRHRGGKGTSAAGAMAELRLSVPLPLLLFLLLPVLPSAQGSAYLSGYRTRSRLQRDRQIRNVRPNIILVLTDDQDMELGKTLLLFLRPSSIWRRPSPTRMIIPSTARKVGPGAAYWRRDKRLSQSHAPPLPLRRWHDIRAAYACHCPGAKRRSPSPDPLHFLSRCCARSGRIIASVTSFVLR